MTTLGSNIKSLRIQWKYNQKELANIIGVSQTSVAHYEAGTRNPTIETLVRLSQMFEKSIDELVGHPTVIKVESDEITKTTDLIDSLVKCLVLKKESEFIETFNNSIHLVYEIENIIDNILKEVMYKVGSLWEQGYITEADEHYATNVVRKVNNYISIKNATAIHNKKAISFSIASEQHTLGIEMVNTYLDSVGIDSIYLGTNVSIRSIEKMITEHNPGYIFISITMIDNMNSLIHFIEYINEKHQEKFIIGIGGQGILDKNNITEIENVYILRDIKELKELLNK